MSEHVYIYVIGREEGPVKVGISNKPWKRVASIQTSCPFKVELLFAMPTKSRELAYRHEKIFHDIYADDRSAGEWFNVEAYLAIEAIETGFEIDAYFHERETRERAVVQ